MDTQSKNYVKALVNKYNEVLLHSMSIAVAEDLINLIVVNGDDKNFKLSPLIKDQQVFRLFVTNEFLRYNSNSVLNELKGMDDNFFSKMRKRKSDKESQARSDF